METAFQQAEEALEAGEVPIGCVFLDKNTGKILGKGRNRTNETYNATRHAEIEAIEDVLTSYTRDAFSSSVLYVTVEPCIMCSAALRYLGVPEVIFGCYNERFGGCGSTLQMDTDPIPNIPILQCSMGNSSDKSRAILLLRRFYLRENARAPRPKRKTNRALKEC